MSGQEETAKGQSGRWAPDCPRCSFSHTPPTNDELANLPPSICRVIQELGILFNVAKTLQEGTQLSEMLGEVLREMAESLGLYRGTLQILNRATGEALVEASCGLAPKEIGAKVETLIAEIGHDVIAAGAGLVVPDVAKPAARIPADELGQQKDWQLAGNVALICVPIASRGEVLGTLSVSCWCKNLATLESDVRLLTLIAQLIAQAVRARQRAHEQIEYLRQENERLQEQLQRHFRPDNIIGNSRAMQTVYHSIEQVAPSGTTVLIRGESGVGKELVAHAIHARSSRKDRAFVKINCAALPEGIVESELFGHERGAFTGAISMRKGRFELAHRGTIFLDEIGELPIATQAKLLRVLQEREFERVGGSETLRCDVRVIAATNRSLEEFVEQGKFRLDLYYRLNVFPVYVPALRERKTDILQLADFFVEKYNHANAKSIGRISTAAIDALMSYHWPGNVRELENCIERASLLATDDVIHGHHLPPTLQLPASQPAGRSTLQAALDGVEREMLVEALKACRGNMAAAARDLGLTERIMGLRTRKYDIDSKSFRS